MLVRNTERMMLFNIQYTMSKCLLKCLTFCSCLFPLLARIAEIILRNYTVLATLIAECLEIKLISAVNQICRFAATILSENLPWPATGIPRNKRYEKSLLLLASLGCSIPRQDLFVPYLLPSHVKYYPNSQNVPPF